MFQIAIVGRPNVGKSTLFNRLCGHRKSIVGDEPGITRDRIYGVISLDNRSISVLDTGGLMPDTHEIIPLRILKQVEKAISESHLILMIVDGRVGVTPLDEQLLPILRKSGKLIWIVVNKIDTHELEAHGASFYSFGFDKVIPVSAEHNRNIGLLLDEIAAQADTCPADAPRETGEEIGVAVVGRPNVGKSSLVNRLLGFERSIVTDIPGTTRDAVDTLLLRDGFRYRLIDTAGIRRKGKAEERAEKASVVMAQKSLEKADVALLLLDAVEGVTKLDANIGGYASESGCSVIIVLNKWDAVEKDQETLTKVTDTIRRRMKYLAYAPILAVSAISGQRVSKLFGLIQRAYEARHLRIPTGTLNNLFVPDFEKSLHLPEVHKTPGIRYITQARSDPPTFVVFMSGRDRMHFSAERHLMNQLREHYGFFAAPIRIQQRFKQSRSFKHQEDEKK